LGRSGDVEHLKRAILLETLLPGHTELHSPKNQCLGKRRHDTEERAHRALKVLSNPEAKAFVCPHCRGWHIGRERKRKF